MPTLSSAGWVWTQRWSGLRGQNRVKIQHTELKSRNGFVSGVRIVGSRPAHPDTIPLVPASGFVWGAGKPGGISPRTPIASTKNRPGLFLEAVQTPPISWDRVTNPTVMIVRSGETYGLPRSRFSVSRGPRRGKPVNRRRPSFDIIERRRGRVQSEGRA